MVLSELENSLTGKTELMPLLFVGHGNPMNAIEDNAYRRTWQAIGKQLPIPKAILCISAHWYTSGTLIMNNRNPETIYDFYGFPPELYKQVYPAPGATDFAGAAMNELEGFNAELNETWGLDHGTWSVLLPMYPRAEIPVFQISIDYTKPPAYHYAIGEKLKIFRERGVLIIGSGNIVHNLRMLRWEGKPFDWAIEFDNLVSRSINEGFHNPLIDYHSFGSTARLAVPTNDHYLPLLYILGALGQNEQVYYFNESIDLGSVSMRSFTTHPFKP